MIIFFAHKIDGDLAYLDTEESRHCLKVLRKREGSDVLFTDGNGRLYSAKILSAKRELVLHQLKILEDKKVDKRIYIAISATKNLNRFEWFIEKAVEIGVTDIIPLHCKRTERDNIKIDRTKKIIRSASKQSLSYTFPILHNSMKVLEIVDRFRDVKINKYIASFDIDNEHLFVVENGFSDTIILIGPEGDFTEEELIHCVDNSYEKVNISIARLRTETAGIVAAEILCLKNELNQL